MRTKLCGICGKEFEVKAKNQRYCCCECKSKATKIAQAKGREKTREAKKKKTEKLSVTEIDKLAKAAGMSYGKYISMTERGDRSYT